MTGKEGTLASNDDTLYGLHGGSGKRSGGREGGGRVMAADQEGGVGGQAKGRKEKRDKAEVRRGKLSGGERQEKRAKTSGREGLDVAPGGFHPLF